MDRPPADPERAGRRAGFASLFPNKLYLRQLCSPAAELLFPVCCDWHVLAEIALASALRDRGRVAPPPAGGGVDSDEVFAQRRVRCRLARFGVQEIAFGDEQVQEAGEAI